MKRILTTFIAKKTLLYKFLFGKTILLMILPEINPYSITKGYRSNPNTAMT